ncbi:class I SAM-dependent methyltransferase [Halobacteria archaeon AArc-m2/3/4]|uniref:Class I SAM-dependent methyltransferase n=1 Tax=Natronoglomus mannanivorans TaxID=2979990 RepID=A0ABT2QJV0_9EURY|nr:class I SAM-dependent methyltransferase [Halobacteria archaeon AArc-m2/3/4]
MTGDVEDWWDATADAFQDEIDMDVGVNWDGFGHSNFELLTDVDGKDVLELGCGGGQCTVALAKRGANLTGIDLSEKQLAHARALADEHDVTIDFRKGSVTDLAEFDDESYDIAFNAWVFQWVEDLDACFAETYRVLRPNGRFVFSLPHPVYDVTEGSSHEVTGSYFETGRREISHDGMDVDQVLFRHTVSGIVNALVDAGFTVDRMHEPGTPDPEDYEPGPWGEYTPALMSKLPAVLILEAHKE